MKVLKKLGGMLIVSFAVCMMISITAFAKDAMKIKSVTSPGAMVFKAEWEKFPGAVNYEFRYGRTSRINAGGNGEKVLIPGEDNTSVELHTKYANQQYAVRVRALGTKGEAISKWSDWATVFILPDQKEKMTLANVTSSSKRKLGIEWNAFKDAVYYEIRLARASVINSGRKGEQKIVDASSNSVSYNVKYGDIDYKVRMRALNKNKKAISDWSDWATVHIQ